MDRQLRLSLDELLELELMIQSDLGSSRVELRHTRTHDYKPVVKRHIEMLERILAEIEQAKAKVGEIDRQAV